MNNTRLHVYIKGRVQGVFFRAWVRDIARRNKVFGWVKNLEDGRVEIVAEGTKRDLEILLLALKKGPIMARVRGVEFSWLAVEHEFEKFEIV